MKTIGIIGAMEVEVAILKEKMEDVRIIKKASMDFYEGILDGKKVVVVRSGIGKVYEAAAPELAVDTVVQIRGQVEKRDETVSMRATEFTVPTLEAQDERPLTIVLPPIALDQSHVRRLGQILTSHPGPCEVKLALMDDKGNAKVLTFGDRFRVKRDTSLFAEIKILFGPSSLPLA